MKLYDSMEPDKRENFWRWLELVVEKMMEKGMLCFIEKDIKRFDYVMKHEAICFCNVMHLLSLLSNVYPSDKYLLSTVNRDLICLYMQLFREINQSDNEDLLYDIVMKKTYFKGNSLRYMNLEGADLRDSCLEGLFLNNANLTGANLSNAFMRGANLMNAKCKFTNFANAVLDYADLSNTDLEYADFSCANLNYTNFENVFFLGTVFKNTIMKNAKLENSLWVECDICAALPQIEEANFDNIRILTTDRGEIIHMTREKLFTTYK